MPLSEPEGEGSDCSSFEEFSSASETEEIILVCEKQQTHGRKDSTASSSSSANYRSWTANRRRGSKPTNVPDDESVESLALINDQKGWWYWTKLALFMATPFIARQLGIFVGKRILSRAWAAK